MLSSGTILSRERKRLGYTLKDVEKHTKIREKFLQALEENEWDTFSSKIYIVGLIKNYADFLGLDREKMIAYFRRDFERREETGKFKRRVESKYFTPETRRVILTGVIMLLLVFGVYFGYQVYLYLQPPKIQLVSPTNTIFRSVDRIQVKGQTEKDATIFIFGERVYPDENGNFEYDFPLQKGENTLVVEITGANGKPNRLERKFILQ